MAHCLEKFTPVCKNARAKRDRRFSLEALVSPDVPQPPRAAAVAALRGADSGEHLAMAMNAPILKP